MNIPHPTGLRTALVILSALLIDLSQSTLVSQESGESFKKTTADRAGADWWSLRRVERPALPVVKDAAWPRNPIDNFILARLESNGLRPAPEADARTLTRRLHFDLTGLPPEPGAESTTPEAAVGKLLASPHYGVRWARHWLDVARFGESNGFEYDQLRPNAWPYRDWVIKALNEDMPYDRFARLQIAGDILEPENPDAITATSFLVCGAFDGLIPQGDKQRKIMRQDEMEDLVGTVSQSFLGLTVHCARCHDHKFDPIRQTEYYQLASALADVRRGDREVVSGTDPAPLLGRREDLSGRLARLDGEIREAILAERQHGELPSSEEPPAPMARWTFDAGLQDEIGGLHGEARGGARVEGGALQLDGREAYVATVPLPSELKAKTLEAWVKLANLDQRGGAALGVQSLDGGQFDALVFGEREPGQWMAGSPGFSRTQSFRGPEEKRAAGEFVHVALVYGEDGAIAAYREGLPYGKPYPSSGPATFGPGSAQVIFGLRHGTSAGSGRMLAGEIDRAQLYDRALTAAEVAASAKVSPITEEQVVARLDPGRMKLREEWKSEIARLDAELQNIGKQKVYAVTPAGAPVTHLLVRGSPFEEGEVVSAGGVASIEGIEADFGLAPDAPGGERRKRLAEWIADPENPLFARAMMNRVWHYHFGQGLVKTPNDLGFSGGMPSHPGLLDWLASEFKAQGWSLKKMHELIVDSATYRQSSKADPAAAKLDAGNVLLWRFSPRRLEAEEIRDAILVVAGELNSAMGGPGFRDFNMYLHKGSWVYEPMDPEGAEFHRRSIYRTWARGSQHPLLSAFDCPDPSATAPVRSVTTTPLGALALMNTSFVIRMSDKFAARLRGEVGGDVEKQVARAYELAYSRRPNAAELDVTSDFVSRNGLPAFCRVVLNSTEFLYVN